MGSNKPKPKNLSRFLPAENKTQNLIAPVNTEVAEAMERVRLKTLKPSGEPISWGALTTGLFNEALKRENPVAFFDAQLQKFRPSLPTNRTRLQARVTMESYEAMHVVRDKLCEKHGFEVTWNVLVEILFRQELARLGVALKS